MTTGASISTKERPSHPAKDSGGPLRYQDVVTLSSHTNKGPPADSHCDHRRARCRYTRARSSPIASFNTWYVHRQQVERHCALGDRAGHKVNQLPGSVAEFEVFLKGKGITAPAADDLFGYPDLRTVTAAMASWPPARNTVCWCGSGRKYKQCCRPHGLGTLD